MVLDEHLRVVDLNPAAQRILAAVNMKAIGQDAHAVLSAWPDILPIVANHCAAHTEIAIEHGSDKRIFDASVSPLLDPAGVSMGTLVLWLDVTEMKAREAELDRQRSALAALAEREQVGRELHDGWAQVLAFVKMEAQVARDALEREHPSEANVALGSIVAIAQEAHEEVRDFLLCARVSAQTKDSFWVVVTDLAERYRSVFGLSVDVSLPKRANELNLDPMTQAQLLRIIPESLANVRRHAGVTEVSLTFTRENGWLQMTVHDDGIGFDARAAPSAGDGHYGLNFMRERATVVGGSLDVISALGQGTTILARVPLAGTEGSHAPAPGG